MNPERWRGLRELVESVLEEPGRREALLAAQPDHEVRSRAGHLLDNPSLAEGAIEPPLRAADLLMSEWLAAALVGQRFGTYRATAVIAAGPMSAVYRGRRDDDAFDREVAIKVLRRGFDTDAARDRFELERRLLARLRHPAVCTLLDAGTTEEGYPYIVMELVEGVPIDRHCRERSLPEIIELFRTVSDAVQSAHATLVVHRDLKPANILVDADGRPKVIDFGIADPGNASGWAAPGEGSGCYRSPEQRAGETPDPRADVYSLGVCALASVLGRPMPDDELAAVVAALRAGRPVGPLARGFGRDLRWILARAVSVDPGRRYASAGLLRDDLARLLRHEPVDAHPPSIIYRANKVARRHPGASAGLLAVAVAVTAAVGATGAALQRARAEATRAQTFARFLTHVLSAADPLNPRTGREGDGLRVTDLLDEAVRRLSADPLGDEAAEAEARSAIAASYAGQGEYAESAAQYRRAAELWARVLGPESGPSLQATSALAMVLSLDGKDDEARRLLDRCVERARRSLGDSHPTTVLASTNRAVCLLFAGDFNLVEEESRRLLELLDRAPRRAPEDPQHSMLEGLRGIALIGRGDVTSAEPMLHRAIDGIPRAGQREELVRGLCLCTLGGVEELKGRPKEAEELYREGYETYRRLLGPDDLRTVTREWSLGTALLETGKFPEAQARLRHVAEVMAALLGDGDWRTVRARQDLECAVTLSRPSAPTDAAGMPDTRDPRPPP